MHYWIKTWIACLFIFLAIPISGLTQEDHKDHDHGHHKNEIGGAVGIFLDLGEEVTSSGFHLHYSRMFGGKVKWLGISPGFEFVFGEHRHYALQLMITFRPTGGWWIGAGPGVSYFDHHEEFQLSGHIETGYEFDAGHVHFGPVVEYSWAEEDQHIMFGIHLGVPF